ncbi:MAG: hypothetical protein WCJ63_08840 [Actinomycetes bacterium]
MTRMKKDLDLVLSISGKGALKGALTPEDLEDIADLMKGLKSFDPSLRNLQMTGAIKAGSAVVGFIAPEPEGLGDIRPARQAARSYFQNGGYVPEQGWTWAKPQRVALDRLTRRGCILGIQVPPSHSNETLFKTKFDRKDYREFSKLIAAEPEWKEIKGRLLEIDFKDRTFEVHTAQGVLTCDFPQNYTEDRFDGMARKVVHAKVLCRTRPKQGIWNTFVGNWPCQRPQVFLLPQPLAGDFSTKQDLPRK